MQQALKKVKGFWLALKNTFRKYTLKMTINIPETNELQKCRSNEFYENVGSLQQALLTAFNMQDATTFS
jgi:hypothetical protein